MAFLNIRFAHAVSLRIHYFRNDDTDPAAAADPQGYDQTIFPDHIFHAAFDCAHHMATQAIYGSYRTGPDEFKPIKTEKVKKIVMPEIGIKVKKTSPKKEVDVFDIKKDPKDDFWSIEHLWKQEAIEVK